MQTLSNILRVFLLTAPLVVTAQDKQDKQVPSKGAPARAETAIPAGAQPVDSSTYRYTDAQGKTWVFRKTPFGVMKTEETPKKEAAEKARQDAGGFTVIDEGDSVRFEQASPFGRMSWIRKKTELTGAERQAWEQQQNRKAQAAGDASVSTAAAGERPLGEARTSQAPAGQGSAARATTTQPVAAPGRAGRRSASEATTSRPPAGRTRAQE